MTGHLNDHTTTTPSGHATIIATIVIIIIIITLFDQGWRDAILASHMQSRFGHEMGPPQTKYSWSHIYIVFVCLQQNKEKKIIHSE